MTNTDKKKDRPFVFVRCLTYNHEKYIEDALKGFVMQKTDFPFVVSIIDDASTDNNASVITDYLQRECDAATVNSKIEEYGKVIGATPADNPNCLLHVVLLNENHYGKKSKRPYYIQFEEKAKYIATCEGDDYWTDPYKLQKQVDILEADGTLMACCTDCSVVDKQGVLLKDKRGGVVKDDVGGRYNLRDFFRDNHQYPTLSVVYRNTHIEEVHRMTDYMKNPFLGDWTLWIALHIFGDFYYLNEVTCAYRINPTSVTHTQKRVARAKANKDICNKVADILPEQYADIAADLRDTRWVWISLIFAYKAEKRYLEMIGSMIMAVILCPKSLLRTIKNKLK